MRIEIPPAVDRIINKLEENGFEAYAVGGCVRDTLLGREPEDWDITTSAKPQEVKRIFPRTIDTGIQHGTVTVMIDHKGYEVTTYRIDGEYEDGRHPKSVAFTPSLTEDLKRRDFTINAMAYNHRRGIVDEFGGMEDLKGKCIRCVGRAEDRFTEDALRILRAIRFSAQLGFDIEPSTFEAVRIIAPNIEKVSKERIQTELTKLLLSDNPDKIALVFEQGIGPYIAPRFSRIPADKKTMEEKLSRPCRSFLPGSGSLLQPVKYLRWAAFLRFSGEDGTKAVLRELKMDNDTIGKASLLVKWCYQEIRPEKTAVRKTMAQMDRELFRRLLELRRFCIKTDLPQENEEELKQLDKIERLADEIENAGDCLYIRELAVTGQDLIASGRKPGKEIGALLQRFLEEVLERPEHNTKEYLLAMADKKNGNSSAMRQDI